MKKIMSRTAGKAITSGGISILIMALTATASANGPNNEINLPAGEDAFSVDNAGFTVQLPPDFFGPGSQPFEGTIVCLGGTDTTDTIIRRAGDITLPPPPSSDTVPIELLELNLVSCQPIVIHASDGNQQQWDVQVGLSPHTVPPGAMTVHRQQHNGGTFDAQLFVQPRFIFTRLEEDSTKDDGEIVPIDDCSPFTFECSREGNVTFDPYPSGDIVEMDASMFEFHAHDVPWTVCPGATPDFCPGPAAFGAEDGWLNLVALPPVLPNDACEFPLPNGGLVVLPTPHNPNPSSDKAQSPEQLRRAADRLEAKGFADEANRLRLIAEAIETIQQGCENLPSEDETPHTPPNLLTSVRRGR